MLITKLNTSSTYRFSWRRFNGAHTQNALLVSTRQLIQTILYFTFFISNHSIAQIEHHETLITPRETQHNKVTHSKPNLFIGESVIIVNLNLIFIDSTSTSLLLPQVKKIKTVKIVDSAKSSSLTCSNKKNNTKYHPISFNSLPSPIDTNFSLFQGNLKALVPSYKNQKTKQKFCFVQPYTIVSLISKLNYLKLKTEAHRHSSSKTHSLFISSLLLSRPPPNLSS